VLLAERIDSGRPFHVFGPATEKARSPIFVLVRGSSYNLLLTKGHM